MNTNDTAYSLSAILLNDDYYRFIGEGRVLIEDCPVVGAEHLLTLKAKAWCELTDRKAEGGAADSKDIRKHRNDVFRLFRVIDPEFDAAIPPKVREDLTRFVEGISEDEVNPADFGIVNLSLEALLAEIRRIDGLE